MYIEHKHTDSDLDKWFGIKGIRTRGTGDGIIYKFHSSYLKIYDYGYSYKIKEYFNKLSNPVRIFEINAEKMQQFACSYAKLQSTVN